MKVIYICNYIHTSLINEQNYTFSQAANNKILDTIDLFDSINYITSVLSYNFVDATFNNSDNKLSFKHSFYTVNSSFNLFLSFFKNKFFRYLHLLSIFLFFSIFKRHTFNNSIVVIYNVNKFSIPFIFICRLFKFRYFIQLEDLDIERATSSFYDILFDKITYNYFINKSYGVFSPSDNILNRLNVKNVFNFKGLVRNKLLIRTPSTDFFHFHVGGYHDCDTGLIELCNSLYIISKESKCRFRLSITGYVEPSLITQLKLFKSDYLFIDNLGFVSYERYLSLMSKIHLAFSLKNHKYLNSTFPSKLIEYASFQIPVVSFKSIDTNNFFNNSPSFLIDDVCDLRLYIKNFISKDRSYTFNLGNLLYEITNKRHNLQFYRVIANNFFRYL